MATMGDRVFLDTNIVLRLINDELPEHTAVRQLVAQYRDQGDELWINRQVIREYLVQVTRVGFLAEVMPIAQVKVQLKQSARFSRLLMKRM